MVELSDEVANGGSIDLPQKGVTMSARKKKERKQEQRRQRNQRAAVRREKRRSRDRGAIVKESRFDQPTSRGEELSLRASSAFANRCGEDGRLELFSDANRGRDEAPTEAETEADLWWGRFSNADGVARLQLTREKLDTVRAGDDAYGDYFPEAIYELEMQLPSHEFVSFLEELDHLRPDVFALSADWHASSMVQQYFAQGRSADIDRAAIRLADSLKKIDEPFFNLMYTLRLAGKRDVAQQLIDVAVKQLNNSGLTYWAVEEILEWALFSPYQQCVTAGVTDEALEALHVAALDLGIEDDEQSRANRRDMAQLSVESR
jgi:hypothetical protein